jgi:hypothetical protein
MEWGVVEQWIFKGMNLALDLELQATVVGGLFIPSNLILVNRNSSYCFSL